nr:hypothetical protein [Gardnerella vaginalis]
LSDMQLFKHTRGLGDSWSNSIRAAPIPNNPMSHHYKQTSTQKTKSKPKRNNRNNNQHTKGRAL